LADHARILRIGRETLVRDRLQRLHIGQHRRPGVLAVTLRRAGIARVSRGSDGGDNLSGCDRCADLGGTDAGDDAGAGRRDGGLHFHRADDQQRRTGFDGDASFNDHFDDVACHRACDALLSVQYGQARRC
jgi:hypothetical protein